MDASAKNRGDFKLNHRKGKKDGKWGGEGDQRVMVKEPIEREKREKESGREGRSNSLTRRRDVKRRRDTA